MLFTFRMIPMITAALASKSIDGRPLLEEAGLPPEAAHGEITAPLSRIQRFVARAASALDADLFGFDLAERVPGGSFGVAEFLVRSAANVEECLRILTDFAPLINPIGRFRFERTDAEATLHYSVPAQRDTLGCHLNEYTIAYLVRQLSALLGEPLPLVRAWFSHARTRGAEQVAARLRTNVAFQAGDCGFALSADILQRVPRTADPDLHRFMSEQARAQLSRVGAGDVISQVAKVIEVRLASGEVAIADIARSMATTVRSLQRHLAEAGATHRDVLAHVRSRRRDELRQAGIADGQIARALGFTDARSMRRSLDDPDAADAGLAGD